MNKFTVHTCISSDGTTIGYRQIGSGQGVIIYHGAGRISQNYERLARVLCDAYTVFLPDRRGRGLSGPCSEHYGLKQAKEDLLAVLQTTSANFIFGHSAGGLIALETVLDYPIQKLAVYEPPLSIGGSVPTAWLAAFEKALERNKRKKAMAIFLKGVRASDEIERMPNVMLTIVVHLLALIELKKTKGTRMLDLLPTLSQDMRIVAELESCSERYAALTTPTLLMAGANSQDYYRKAVLVLEATIAGCCVKTYPGFDHFSPEEKVEEIAKDLKQYFLPSSRA